MGKDGAVTASQAALDRYAGRLRRDRIRYTIGVSVLVVAASVIAAVVWLNGEIAHTTLHTVAKAPADVPLATPAAVQRKLWSTTDYAALGTPYSGGSVVTYDKRTVRGRDGRTGAQTWSYTRTDRTVCTALQLSNVTVAVYRLNGNCDELTALDTGTGRRQWTRTLDMDTHQLNGVPQFSVSGSTAMFVSPTVIYAINTQNGYNAWVYAEQKCTISRAVLGTTGALIAQTCAHRDCSELKHCLNGPQLVFRDPAAGENTDSSKNKGNPDQIFWNLPNPGGLVPASAGAVVSALTPNSGVLHVYASKDGKTLTNLTLSGPASSGEMSTDTPTSDGELIWVPNRTYAVTGTPAKIVWSIVGAAAPSVTGTAIGFASPLEQSRLATASATGIAELSPADGHATSTFAVSPAPRSTARIYPYGDGYLVSYNGVTVYG